MKRRAHARDGAGPNRSHFGASQSLCSPRLSRRRAAVADASAADHAQARSAEIQTNRWTRRKGNECADMNTFERCTTATEKRGRAFVGCVNGYNIGTVPQRAARLISQESPGNMAFSANDIAKKGEEIYRQKYQAEYEQTHFGDFVVIDISSGEAFRAKTPEEAMEHAQQSKQDGLFHLIKVGSAGAYHVSTFSHG